MLSYLVDRLNDSNHHHFDNDAAILSNVDDIRDTDRLNEGQLEIEGRIDMFGMDDPLNGLSTMKIALCTHATGYWCWC